jgi:type IV pilus assembly protein PilB
MDSGRIRSALLRNRVLTREEFDRLAEESRTRGDDIAQLLANRGVISSDELNLLLAREFNAPFIDLTSYIFEPDVVRLIPAPVARSRKLIPVFRINDSLTVAMANPADIQAVDELRRITRLAIVPALSPERDIDQAIAEQYGADPEQATAAETIREYAASQIQLELPDNLQVGSPEDLADQAPIVRYINEILTRATTEHASDIHFEPDSTELRVRLRVDGLLRIVSRVPLSLAPALASRIKILAKMNIAEKRHPQDGQFETHEKGDTPPRGVPFLPTIDVRVSSFPTIYGENLVLRLLDKSNVALGLDQLGLAPEMATRFRELLRQPYGIILATGPTGSGKTTTLYAALQLLNSEDKNIITIEDPVEYHLPLVRQSQINPRAGITFAAGLRAILRQDPDIIMVGEIRDAETAEIAVQAAMTGHLVLSTLHTNDAASAITRLTDMGIEPFLVASALVAVVAQRLVRRVCDRCRTRVLPDPVVAAALKLPEGAVLSRGRGCPYCRNTGYRGRLGTFELLTIDDEVRHLTMKRAASSDIAGYAVAQGMRTLRDDGIQKVIQGLTTAEELVRVAGSR